MPKPYNDVFVVARVNEEVVFSHNETIEAFPSDELVAKLALIS